MSAAPLSPWLADLGSPATRKYLLCIAEHHLEPDLRRRFGASDLVQDTLGQATHAIDQFAGTCIEQLLGWLRTMLLRLLSNRRREAEAAARDVRREVPLAH